MKRLIWGLLIGLVQPIQADQYSLDWYQQTLDKSELVQGFNNHKDINNLVAVETVLHEQQKVALEALLQASLTRKQAQIYQFLGSGLEAGAGVIAHQAVQRQFGTLADLGAVADRATYLYQQILKAEPRLLGVPSMPPVIVASPNVGASATGTGSISTPSPAVGSSTLVTPAPAPAPAGRPQLPANLLAALTQKNNQAALNPVLPAPAPVANLTMAEQIAAAVANRNQGGAPVVATTSRAKFTDADKQRINAARAKNMISGLKIAIPVDSDIWESQLGDDISHFITERELTGEVYCKRESSRRVVCQYGEFDDSSDSD